MPKLTLTYFDFDGGRGEVARLVMHIGGLPFEDRRIAFKDWAQHRDEAPFRALPILAVDGRLMTQSNAINRYLGKLTGLYPKDDWQAALCDEVMGAVEDLDHQLGFTIDMDAGRKQKAREDLVAGLIPRYLEQFQARLKAAGGEYFAGGALSVGDLKAWMMVRWLRSGVLDHIPKDAVDRLAPLLVRHAERLAAHPKIAAYYAARGK
ncbi:MAG: glutathione S-transferase family protein [Nevskiaceae bacterium]